MGKKSRNERSNERELFAKKRAREKLRTKLIATAVIASIGAIVVYSALMFSEIQVSGPGAPPGAGPLGSEHSHVGIQTRIFGELMDFSSGNFQVKNRYAHFEGGDGSTIHQHATGVPMGYFLETLGIKIDPNCIQLPNSDEFCDDKENSLKFFINHEPVFDIRGYVGEEGDRVLISYGKETLEELDGQLRSLDFQTLKP